MGEMERELQWWKGQLAADIHQSLRIKVSLQSKLSSNRNAKKGPACVYLCDVMIRNRFVPSVNNVFSCVELHENSHRNVVHYT